MNRRIKFLFSWALVITLFIIFFLKIKKLILSSNSEHNLSFRLLRLLMPRTQIFEFSDIVEKILEIHKQYQLTKTYDRKLYSQIIEKGERIMSSIDIKIGKEEKQLTQEFIAYNSNKNEFEQLKKAFENIEKQEKKNREKNKRENETSLLFFSETLKKKNVYIKETRYEECYRQSFEEKKKFFCECDSLISSMNEQELEEFSNVEDNKILEKLLIDRIKFRYCNILMKKIATNYKQSCINERSRNEFQVIYKQKKQELKKLEHLLKQKINIFEEKLEFFPCSELYYISINSFIINVNLINFVDEAKESIEKCDEVLLESIKYLHYNLALETIKDINYKLKDCELIIEELKKNQINRLEKAILNYFSLKIKEFLHRLFFEREKSCLIEASFQKLGKHHEAEFEHLTREFKKIIKSSFNSLKTQINDSKIFIQNCEHLEEKMEKTKIKYSKANSEFLSVIKELLFELKEMKTKIIERLLILNDMLISEKLSINLFKEEPINLETKAEEFFIKHESELSEKFLILEKNKEQNILIENKIKHEQMFSFITIVNKALYYLQEIIFSLKKYFNKMEHRSFLNINNELYLFKFCLESFKKKIMLENNKPKEIFVEILLKFSETKKNIFSLIENCEIEVKEILMNKMEIFRNLYLHIIFLHLRAKAFPVAFEELPQRYFQSVVYESKIKNFEFESSDNELKVINVLINDLKVEIISLFRLKNSEIENLDIFNKMILVLLNEINYILEELYEKRNLNIEEVSKKENEVMELQAMLLKIRIEEKIPLPFVRYKINNEMKWSCLAEDQGEFEEILWDCTFCIKAKMLLNIVKMKYCKLDCFEKQEQFEMVEEMIVTMDHIMELIRKCYIKIQKKSIEEKILLHVSKISATILKKLIKMHSYLLYENNSKKNVKRIEVQIYEWQSLNMIKEQEEFRVGFAKLHISNFSYLKEFEKKLLRVESVVQEAIDEIWPYEETNERLKKTSLEISSILIKCSNMLRHCEDVNKSRLLKYYYRAFASSLIHISATKEKELIINKKAWIHKKNSVKEKKLSHNLKNKTIESRVDFSEIESFLFNFKLNVENFEIVHELPLCLYAVRIFVGSINQIKKKEIKEIFELLTKDYEALWQECFGEIQKLRSNELATVLNNLRRIIFPLTTYFSSNKLNLNYDYFEFEEKNLLEFKTSKQEERLKEMFPELVECNILILDIKNELLNYLFYKENRPITSESAGLLHLELNKCMKLLYEAKKRNKGELWKAELQNNVLRLRSTLITLYYDSNTNPQELMLPKVNYEEKEEIFEYNMFEPIGLIKKKTIEIWLELPMYVECEFLLVKLKLKYSENEKSAIHLEDKYKHLNYIRLGLIECREMLEAAQTITINRFTHFEEDTLMELFNMERKITKQLQWIEREISKKYYLFKEINNYEPFKSKNTSEILQEIRILEENGLYDVNLIQKTMKSILNLTSTNYIIDLLETTHRLTSRLKSILYQPIFKYYDESELFLSYDVIIIASYALSSLAWENQLPLREIQYEFRNHTLTNEIARSVEQSVITEARIESLRYNLENNH